MQQTNLVAIVTGAGSGIGRATALRFASAGYRVMLADKAQAMLETTHQLIVETGGQSATCNVDVTSENECQDMTALTLQKWGRIDALVANAGVQIGGSLLESNEDDWQTIIGGNLKGVAYCCKAVLPNMVEQKAGAMVLVSSVNAINGSAGMAIYDASKAGVLALMRNLAVEYGNDNIRVNAVCPGDTITDFHINNMAKEGISEAQLREMTKGYALLGRAAEPTEIADAIYFLASDQASFITGHTLCVDGGFSITGGGKS